MKREELLFSWKDLAYSEDKTVFWGVRFNDSYGKWKKGEFIECLVFKHSNHRLEEVGKDGKVVRRKKVKL